MSSQYSKVRLGSRKENSSVSKQTTSLSGFLKPTLHVLPPTLRKWGNGKAPFHVNLYDVLVETTNSGGQCRLHDESITTKTTKQLQVKKEETSLSALTKAPRKIKTATSKHETATNNVKYTVTIVDRLMAVNWSNKSHPTGVVKPVYGIQTFPLTAKVV